MDALEKLIDRRENVSQFLIGDDWDQKLDEDHEDHNSPLMDSIIISS